MPFFSVVIPVYNKVATLAASLSSLFQQTFRDFEVIAVDDGSTDGSYELLEQHARKGRLRLLQRDEPGPGGQAARNLGAEEAKASWLVFFDAEDILLFDHLSRFAEAIARHPDIELFVNAFQKMEGHQRQPRTESIPTGVLARREALEAFSYCDFINMNGVCIRRGRFLALGGFPAGRYRHGGDVYFWLKALCALEAIHYDDTVTSLWLIESNGTGGGKNGLDRVHPSVDLLAEFAGRLSWYESHYLQAAVNRKVLCWAVKKKRLGKPVRADLASLTLVGMRPRQWLQVLMLLMPQPCFERMRGWWKS
ncbi:glycosyltransferase family A protein [Halomonas sp. A29]|uniref:glycosyltransferase family A protein n=1 Tax=Halomonas sp. A29 TaxID=3102786 RepID=UPI00398B9C76